MANLESQHIDPSEIYPRVEEWAVGNKTKEALNSKDSFEQKLKSLGWSEDEAADAAIVYSEFLFNARDHGNLGVNKEKFKQELKKARVENYNDLDAEQEWEDEVVKASELPENAHKKVAVILNVLSPKHIELKIQDEGKNTQVFWENHGDGELKKSLDNPVEHISGRGVITADYLLDRLGGQRKYEKNEKGVKVIVEMDLDKKH